MFLMKPRIFITMSFQGNKNKQEIEHLCELVNNAGFKDFCFIRDVENYKKIFDSPDELMKRTKEEIEKSEYLLIDMTDKPTGRAFEAGMAYVLNKKIIVILKRGTQIKDTTRGIANIIIEYDKIDEIVNPLMRYIKNYNN
jgi:nucleoside 2-deoxyribosyltransferase